MKRVGCDTSYAEGASAIRVDETTIRVTAGGNGRTKPEAVYRFAMRKAAEATLAAGYDLFAVVEQADTTRRITGVQGGGSDGMGGVRPVSSYDIIRPGQAFTIKLLRGEKASDAAPNVYAAREVLKYMELSP